MIDVTKLTQKLVRCPSVTPEDAGSQKIIKDILIDLGFEIFDLPFEGDGSYPVKNFFARKGKSAPHFCYMGHNDVVPAGDESAWRHPPFEAHIDGDIMYGRGTSDMKGGNAAFISSLSDFLLEHNNFEGSISVIIIGDEEADRINGAAKVVQWLNENNQMPDFCLVGEPSNTSEIGEAIKVGRRGSCSGKVIVKGTQGHVAYPQFAQNPLPALCTFGTALSTYIFDEGTEFFSATNLEITNIEVSNTASNLIPAEGIIHFNIRFNTRWTFESLNQKLHEVLKTVGDDYVLKTGGNSSPFQTQINQNIDDIAEIIQTHTGKMPEYSTGGGTSDAAFIAAHCSVIEFGLTNETIHKVDECLNINDLKKLVIIYKDILSKFFTK